MMMKKTATIYLTGQNNFGNRGCEALVRSTVTVLTEAMGPVHVLVPSLDKERDAAQWPDHADHGVEFVDTHPMPRFFAKWHGATQKFPWLQSLPQPRLHLPPAHEADLARADVLLSIGGDNYSLDYGLASLFYFVGIAERFLSQGKPALLWGASVGPFAREPRVERRMAEHLKRLTLVTVRESRSINYLKGIGVAANVLPVVDSAFALQPEPIVVEGWWPTKPGDGVLGLNIGWLIDSLRRRNGAENGVVDEVVDFVKHVISSTNLSVILVPHVSPLDGGSINNDELFNSRLLAACGGATDRLAAVDSGLNAAQLKYVISKCRFLIAARTHATIAAFSTAVPTISIAYSVKAKGINLDLFGHERYVLETPKLSTLSLSSALRLLMDEEEYIRRQYSEILPAARERARLGAKELASRVS